MLASYHFFHDLAAGRSINMHMDLQKSVFAIYF